MAKKTAKKKKQKKNQEELPLHEQLPPVTFSPMGAADQQKDQGNLIAAKQSPVFLESGGLVARFEKDR